MSYNILVTGGAGYFGSTMVPDLLAAGHKVTVLDNFMFKQASLNHCAYHSDFSVVKGDIRVEKNHRTTHTEGRCHHSPRRPGRGAPMQSRSGRCHNHQPRRYYLDTQAPLQGSDRAHAHHQQCLWYRG